MATANKQKMKTKKLSLKFNTVPSSYHTYDPDIQSEAANTAMDKINVTPNALR